MSLSAGAIALLLGIAGSAAATGGIGSAIGSSVYDERKKKFIDELVQKGYSRSDAEYLASNYEGTAFNAFDPSSWFKNHDLDRDALSQDYQDFLSWRDKVGPMPETVDIDGILKNASDTIDSENAQISSLYDQILGRQAEAYRQQITENNQSFNDYRQQILSNQAQQSNMLQGSVRSELERSQRNAITRGASAAQRLVANINTQLGLQNKAAQQSLETSNQLAQALLNQRQAASSIRQGYMNDLNADAQRRTSLIQGTAERKTNYANLRLNEANNIYNQKLQDWNDNLAGYGGTNPYADYLRNQQSKNRGNNGNGSYGI